MSDKRGHEAECVTVPRDLSFPKSSNFSVIVSHTSSSPSKMHLQEIVSGAHTEDEAQPYLTVSERERVCVFVRECVCVSQ